MIAQIQFIYRSSKLRYWKNIFFKNKFDSNQLLFIHPPRTSGTYISKSFKIYEFLKKNKKKINDKFF